jgi:flagellar biosynthesis/type III secretory pathway M-ring protein FliF/YscJ
VTAQLNTDSRQIQETVYDPESRVERSIRTSTTRCLNPRRSRYC